MYKCRAKYSCKAIKSAWIHDFLPDSGTPNAASDADSIRLGHESQFQQSSGQRSFSDEDASAVASLGAYLMRYGDLH